MLVYFLVDFCLFPLICLSATAETGPQPGEVYREYTQNMSGNTGWRVTDPDCEVERSHKFLPNPIHRISVDDLDGVVRAEALLDRWGGHRGTYDKQIRFNDNAWIRVPELTTTPAGSKPESYMFQDNPIVEVPLEHLREGENTFQGTCKGTWWGQWGMYSLILRVYYDPEQKSHPSGRIASPTNGQELGEDPKIIVEAVSKEGIERIDVLAFYEGCDENGDGIYQEWHRSYFQPARGEAAEIQHHVGTITSEPYEIIWDTKWVPDQIPKSIKLLARISDKQGLWYVTQAVEDLCLVRSDCSVKLYKASDVSERFSVRAGNTKKCKIAIPPEDDLNKAVESSMYLRTWHGFDKVHSDIKFNDWSMKAGGKDHHYAYNSHLVPISTLRNGDNVITFHSNTKGHGLEVLWPGPGLIVRYETSETGKVE